MTLSVSTVAELGIDSRLVCDFYRDNWARRICLQDMDFYRWQFMSSPAGAGRDHCVVAYDSDLGRVAGVMGLDPRPFHLAGRLVAGAELTTWVVAESYRKTGIGGVMLSYIQDHYDALIGMGISQAALPVYLRSGFRFLASIPRYIRVYNLDVAARFGQVDPLVRKLERARRPSGDEAFVADPADPAGIDAVFERVARDFNVFARDRAHVRWRYDDHPVFDYRTFLVRRKAGDGAAVFVALRLESAVEGLRMMHVLDCIGDEAALPAAFAFIDDLCLAEKIDIADFFCTAARVNKYPLGRGWFSTLDDRHFKFPHLFHPIELRDPATTSLVYWSKADLVEMCDFSRLYITKQDADLDRPVPEETRT